MRKTERGQELLALLRETGGASVGDLSSRLFASASTVRRTLSELESQGLIRRTHGGAELLESHTRVAAFAGRMQQNAAAKREIARKAAALVPDGSVVILDQSSTAYCLAEELMKKSDLTVATNNLEIAGLLSQTSFAVFLSGGHLCPDARNCLIGDDAQRLFREINADFTFFSARSLSEGGVASDCNRDEIFVRRAMLENAARRVFLCDSSKFGSRSPFRQCSLSELDALVSEGDSASRFAEDYPSLRTL